jgi:23S rRNA (adenine-N6)-dimethyltransferase
VSGNGSRRQWGWHPLDPEWAARIVLDAGIRPGDLVLDLGAGTGRLTEPLVEAGAHVLAVELHPGRAAAIRARFAAAPVRVLQVDLARFRLPDRPFRVVSSPPYRAGTAVVRMLLGSPRLQSADLVLQRAAVRRLVERPPRARHARRYRLERGRSVPRSAFRPPPRVDSAVLAVRRVR